VVCLSNLGTMNPDLLCHQVADLYLEDIMEAQPEDTKAVDEDGEISLSDEMLQQKTGVFQDKESGAVARVMIAEDGLILETMGMPFTLEALSATHFRTIDAPATLDIFFENENARMTVDVNNGMQKLTFERIDDYKLTPDQLKEYAGSYHSEELDVHYQLIVDAQQLQIEPKSPFFPPLKPVIPDSFSAGMANIKFLRNSNGEITGFSINAGRVKDIRFLRQM
jgi:hypothetical protein